MVRVNQEVERIKKYGAGMLSNAELVSIVLGNHKGKNDTHEIAKNMTKNHGLYKTVARMHQVNELMETYQVTGNQAAAILASIELGRRIVTADAIEAEHITSPGDGAAWFMPRLRHENQEIFMVMALNTKNRIIGVKQIAQGSLTSAVVHPREVYQYAVVNHAACILVAHNHPSGDPYPSTQDRELTKALEEAGNVMGIPLLDHLVIGDARYYSFKEHGHI